MTGHPRYGAPDHPNVEALNCNQNYQSNLSGEIGSQWGNFSPGGPVISKFRRNLYSFGDGGTLQTPMQTSRVGRSMQSRLRGGEGGAPGRCRGEGRRDRERICGFAWCLWE